METPITIHFDEAPVRFTSDGKIAVLDAIAMLFQGNESQALWERMKSEHPDILKHCESHAFTAEAHSAVIDKEGWGKLWEILPQYLL